MRKGHLRTVESFSRGTCKKTWKTPIATAEVHPESFPNVKRLPREKPCRIIPTFKWDLSLTGSLASGSKERNDVKGKWLCRVYSRELSLQVRRSNNGKTALTVLTGLNVVCFVDGWADFINNGCIGVTEFHKMLRGTFLSWEFIWKSDVP